MKEKKKGFLAGVLALSCCASLGLGVGLTGLAENEPTVSPVTQTEEAQTEDRAYYVNKEESTVEYGQDPNSTLSGIKADLALDDVLTVRNVIDLEEMAEKDQPFIHIQPIVTEPGKADYTKITLEVIDTYDPNNYFKIQIGATPQQEDTSMTSYFLAGASNGQKLTGYENGHDKLHVNNEYGQWSLFSFGCTMSHRSGTGFYYDTEEKQIYAVSYSGEKRMIIDFDNPAFFGTYLWDGFTTNEVYCRLSCSSYKKDKASIMISQYGDYDLTKAEIHDVVAPTLTVDYGEYTKETVPSALAREKYKIFDAKSFDTVDGEIVTDIKVYTDYYSLNKKELTVRSGKFTPRLTQPHYIVYTAVDAHGNKSEEIVIVNVVSSSEPLAIDFENVAYTTVEGDLYKIPAYTISGGLGNVKLTMKATLNGEELAIENGGVRPYASGKMKIVYTLQDYVEQEYEVEHEITVTDAVKPTFIEEPILPKYLIANNRYPLPVLSAYDYVTAEGEAIPTTVSVVENGVTKALTNGEYTVGDVSQAEIVYTAKIGNATNEYRKTLPVYSVRSGDGLDMAKYFLPEGNGTAAASGYSVKLTATEKESFEFINYVTALELFTEFSLSDNFANLKKFDIVLTDIVDSDKQLKFSYAFDGEGIVFYVNDDVAGAVSVTGTPQKDMRFYLGFNASEKKVSYDISNSNILPITAFLNGEAFDGFTQSLAYVTYALEEVVGEASVAIHTLNGHYFSEEKSDWIAPLITLEGDVGGEYTLWDEMVLPKIIANDVLAGNVDAYVTLTTPTGSYVTTVDGKVLNNLRYDGSELKVVMSEYGDYMLSISAQDNSGVPAQIFAGYSVVDKIKPELSIGGEIVSTAKVGENVNVPKATATDNLGGELKIVAYVIMPSGPIVEITAADSGFKATVAGVYTVVYSVSDAEGNFVSKYYKIKVTEA